MEFKLDGMENSPTTNEQNPLDTSEEQDGYYRAPEKPAVITISEPKKKFQMEKVPDMPIPLCLI